MNTTSPFDDNECSATPSPSIIPSNPIATPSNAVHVDQAATPREVVLRMPATIAALIIPWRFWSNREPHARTSPINVLIAILVVIAASSILSSTFRTLSLLTGTFPWIPRVDPPRAIDKPMEHAQMFGYERNLSFVPLIVVAAIFPGVLLLIRAVRSNGAPSTRDIWLATTYSMTPLAIQSALGAINSLLYSGAILSQFSHDRLLPLITQRNPAHMWNSDNSELLITAKAVNAILDHTILPYTLWIVLWWHSTMTSGSRVQRGHTVWFILLLLATTCALITFTLIQPNAADLILNRLGWPVR
ncbi:MAG: hypothetical protein NTV94_00720 [Planctomycetota bacterium]|nr:hypothetical protein [Planctomycetota bacterium]